MNRGFSVLELLVALSLGLGVLAVVISCAGDSVRLSRRFGDEQEQLEAVFHTVDTLRSDFERCGMRLQEPFALGFPVVACEADHTRCTLFSGEQDASVVLPALAGERTLLLTAEKKMAAGDQVLLYEPFSRLCEEHRLAQVTRDEGRFGVTLSDPTSQPVPGQSTLVALNRVEYRWFAADRILKRKTGRGTFQPLLTGVHDFFVAYFPESRSILYRIELPRKQQIRGYLFLANVRIP